MDLVNEAKSRLRPKRHPNMWPPEPCQSTAVRPNASTPQSSSPPLRARHVAVVEDATVLSPAAFRSRFELPGCPAVLGGLLNTWAAMPTAARSPRSWTMRNLARRLGGQEMACGDDTAGATVLLQFGAFVGSYLRGCPDRNPMFVFDATCIEVGAAMAQLKGDCNLGADYRPPAIFAEEDFLSHLLEARPPYQWLIVAPARSGSPVHTDPMATMAWNALLEGKKRWVMFHPATPAELLTPWLARHKHLQPPCIGGGLESDDEWEDLLGWFNEDLPVIRQAVARHFRAARRELEVEEQREKDRVEEGEWWCVDFVQHAGQTVFVPSMWHHAVLNLSDTVAVTHNYVSRSNLAATYRRATGVDTPVGKVGEMDAALCTLWRERMLANVPELTAQHMPRAFLV
eukprot:COSAG05_NODE_173_length_14969_cov_29.555884_2_plen_400_part_00